MPAPLPLATSHMDRVFDALFVPCAPDPDPQCDLCDKRQSAGCRCWVRLRCAVCRDTEIVQRVIAEDGDDDEVITLCPSCAPADPPRSA